MSLDNRLIGGEEVTPYLIASLFWEMDDGEQADFFAALNRIAGCKLCLQMGWCVREMHKRSERGDHDAQHGFQTMLAHAQQYVMDGIESRVWAAKWDISGMVDRAKQEVSQC